MNKIKFSIANDYSKRPGPRYIWQGPDSGEHFLNNVLINLFDEAINKEDILWINLDGTAGYGPSFLEESFGGLARIRNKNIIKRHLKFVSSEEPFLIDEINDYIENAVPEET